MTRMPMWSGAVPMVGYRLPPRGSTTRSTEHAIRNSFHTSGVPPPLKRLQISWPVFHPGVGSSIDRVLGPSLSGCNRILAASSARAANHQNLPQASRWLPPREWMKSGRERLVRYRPTLAVHRSFPE